MSGHPDGGRVHQKAVRWSRKVPVAGREELWGT